MFTEETIQQVWDKAQKVEGYNPATIRKDGCGAWILRAEYGNTESIFGWEIDHIYPVSSGGDDSLINLRAFQWENNRSKGDDYPVYKVTVQSEENTNVYSDKQYTVNAAIQDQLKTLYNIE